MADLTTTIHETIEQHRYAVPADVWIVRDAQ